MGKVLDSLFKKMMTLIVVISVTGWLNQFITGWINERYARQKEERHQSTLKKGSSDLDNFLNYLTGTAKKSDTAGSKTPEKQDNAKSTGHSVFDTPFKK